MGKVKFSENSALTHTANIHTRLTALCPGLPGWAGTRKEKPMWITEARDSEWQWHPLGHMQVCTSLESDNHASTPPLSFYRPDALPAAQPTASKHWRHRSHILLRDPQIINEVPIPPKHRSLHRLDNSHHENFHSSSSTYLMARAFTLIQRADAACTYAMPIIDYIWQDKYFQWTQGSEQRPRT